MSGTLKKEGKIKTESEYFRKNRKIMSEINMSRCMQVIETHLSGTIQPK